MTIFNFPIANFIEGSKKLIISPPGPILSQEGAGVY